MFKKGYYDLLLKINDVVDGEHYVKDLKDESINIRDIDKYLIKQFNKIVASNIRQHLTVNSKIAFLNEVISSFSKEEQLSNNVLLQIGKSLNDYQCDIRLIDNHLFTNQNEQELVNQLNAEIKTADAVYFIYPFISKAMLNKIKDSLQFANDNNIAVHFITTTFDDLALYVNLYELERLVLKYSNIMVRIEDNTEKRSERIHIKAAIFARKSGFSTAIVGSSNLTYKGMISGREWNIRISEFSNFSLYNNLITEYMQIWKDRLLNFNDEATRKHLLAKVLENQLQKQNALKINPKYHLYDFQHDIIARLKYRRLVGKTKHLIIMATGTGKTVVSAFDYYEQIVENHHIKPRILFLAHQKEIIDQALNTFRSVLQDSTFGEIFYSGKKLQNTDALFATIQSIHRHLALFNNEHFDIIIFDEVHHLVATTFIKVFNYFKAKQVIGLTATPEREDNKLISSYFNDEFAYELRLWDAINERLLCPFDYYCIDDLTSNLAGIDLDNDELVFNKLNNNARNELLLNIITEYIGIYAKPSCLIFCITIKHAKIVAHYLKQQGLAATYLTSEVAIQRTEIINQFKKKNINYLCVVNMFNEGIDVPEIDTLILLRPTSSKTVYLQQLGRGLRKTMKKNKLEVYDLIANIDQKYDITVGIKNLYHSRVPNIKAITQKQGLPYGCTITLEQRSQKIILNNLQRWYQNKNRLRQEIKKYYDQFQANGLLKILEDYDLSLPAFYNFIDDFYLRIGKQIKEYHPLDNDFKRNKNILKQFIFLNNYNLLFYFYLRLQNKVATADINYEYDNLLICSLLYEVTSLVAFKKIYPEYSKTDDLILHFINVNRLIVEELLLILKYKLDYETLLTDVSINNYSLLKPSITYTVRQALCAIKRVNFISQNGPIRIIAFQAGHLTFDETKAVIFADMDGNKYGKKTKYFQENNKRLDQAVTKYKQQYFHWSIPETKNLQSKLVTDLQNERISKFLFLNNKVNQEWTNLHLKLYDFVGIGKYYDIDIENYITLKFFVTTI